MIWLLAPRAWPPPGCASFPGEALQARWSKALLGLFNRIDPARQAAERLHKAISARARAPVFYARFNVADNIDGRFDLFTLHTFLVLDGLKQIGGAGWGVGEHLANCVFAGFKDALREMGVGDMGLSRRIKAMANAFYGRLAAYEAAGSEQELAEALTRNLYRGENSHGAEARALAHYMMKARALVRGQDLSQGQIDFGPLPLSGEKIRNA